VPVENKPTYGQIRRRRKAGGTGKFKRALVGDIIMTGGLQGIV
jgi:hypothetical protein